VVAGLSSRGLLAAPIIETPWVAGGAVGAVLTGGWRKGAPPRCGKPPLPTPRIAPPRPGWSVVCVLGVLAGGLRGRLAAEAAATAEAAGFGLG
jgi:hypothetical protein